MSTLREIGYNMYDLVCSIIGGINATTAATAAKPVDPYQPQERFCSYCNSGIWMMPEHNTYMPCPNCGSTASKLTKKK